MELKHRIVYGNLTLRWELLIVPYGIETLSHHVYQRGNICLLIVPYGIETEHIRQPCRLVRAFNRTLWN